MRKLGEELIIARERRDLSLEEVSATTKIDIKFLKALEADDFEVLPDPYVKAFIRSYASTVGANVSNLMRIYEESRSSVEEEAEEAAEAEPVKDSPDIFEILANIWKERKTLILSAAGAIVLLAAVIAIVTFRPESPPEVRQAETEKVTPRPDETGFKFSVSAREPLYLMVSIDGGDSLDYNLAAESAREFLAEDSIWILSGNMAAIRMSLGGETIDHDAGEGQAAHFMVYENGVGEMKTFKLLNNPG